VARWSGRLNLDPGQPVVVALTQARLDPDRRKPFDRATRRIFGSLGSRPGILGYSVRTRIGAAEVWTMTVWTDEASMDGFLASELHRSAIRDGRGSLVGGRTLRRSLPASRVPLPWKVAEELLEREGTDVMSPPRPESQRGGR
jgi:quinol monooxygenase YgiN